MNGIGKLALLTIVGGAALTVGCGPSGSSRQIDTAVSRSPKILSAAHLGPRKAGEASAEGRMIIGRGKDYTPIAEDPAALFARLEGSMADRRTAAWKVVEEVLEPQKLVMNGGSYDVPLWHTWYEGMSVNAEVDGKINLFFANLARCRADAICRKSNAQIATETMASIQQAGQKDLARSLRAENLTQTLHQFEGIPNARADELGRGFTLFSPSFVEHVLSQAQGIEECADNRVAWNAPPPSSTQFSPCIDEFPRSAVMIKTQWAELPRAATAPATDSASMTKMLAAGTWPPLPGGAGDPSKMYAVETQEGKTYGLRALHISTKDTREWLWISLWWSPDPNSDFGEDRPAAIARFNGGVWMNYKMCVTSSFNEGDPAPWRSFEPHQPKLAAALKATHESLAAQRAVPPYDRVTSWCSNVNIERQTNNGQTNCIGCHQYSMAWSGLTNDLVSFDDTLNSAAAYQKEYPQFGRSRRRANFPGDFSWSFYEESMSQKIKDARERYHLTWAQKGT